MKNNKRILVGFLALVFTFVLIPQFTFARAIAIKSISNISVSVQKGVKYKLPTTVKAQLATSKTQSVAVKWNVTAVKTNTAGTFKFSGTVKDYSKKVILTLKVVEVKKTATPEPKETEDVKATSTPTPKPTPTPAADGVSGATVAE